MYKCIDIPKSIDYNADMGKRARKRTNTLGKILAGKLSAGEQGSLSAIFTFRISEREHDEMSQVAEHFGISVSRYLRKLHEVTLRELMSRGEI